MDKREFVVQSVVDGKVTGQLKTEKLGIAYDLQSQMVNGIGVDVANGALIAKSAYVEIIEANYRSRVNVVVPQPVSDVQHLLDDIKAYAVELRRVTGLYKSMVKMKEEVMAELEDMKIERDTYRDNLKVLRAEQMGLDKANKINKQLLTQLRVNFDVLDNENAQYQSEIVSLKARLQNVWKAISDREIDKEDNE